MVYHYDVAYDNPPSPHMPSSSIDPPPNSPLTILREIKAHKCNVSFPSTVASLTPIYGQAK